MNYEQQAVRALVAQCKERGEDHLQACEALNRAFPDLPIAALEDAISAEYVGLTPEEWAKILAIKVSVEEAAVRLRKRFPDLPAARMASALNGAFTNPKLTPDRLMVALAEADYEPKEAAPAVRQEFSAVQRVDMLLLLYVAYSQLDREQSRAAMAAASYSNAAEWVRLDRLGASVDRFGLGMIKEQVYIVGGQRNVPSNLHMRYSLRERVWHYCAPLPTARRQLCLGVINGKLYAVGGTNGVGGDIALAVNEEYDPQTDTWTRKAPPPGPVLNAASAVVNNKLYVLGGHDVHVDDAQAFEYDPAEDRWTVKAPPLWLWSTTSVAGVINGRIHVLSRMPSMEMPVIHSIYDPATDTWERKEEVPDWEGGRSNFAAGVIDGKIYLLGGERFTRQNPWDHGTWSDLDTSLLYDPASDYWSPALSLPEPRSSAAAVTIAELGLLLVLGGRAEMLALMVG